MLRRLASTGLALCLLFAARVGAADEPAAPAPTTDLRALHSIGLYGRGLFVPESVMSLGLETAQPLNSGAIGLSYTHHKGTLAIVTSLDFSFFSPNDGNFLGSGKLATIDTHYTQFRDLNFLSLDISFYYVRDITQHVAFMIGGGIGLGLVLGDVLVVNNQGAGCSGSTVGDVNACHPVVDPSGTAYTRVGNPAPTWTDTTGKVRSDWGTGALVPSDPDFSRKLDGLVASQQECKAKDTGLSDCRDTAQHPYAHHAPEKPPVMVVINIQLGLKFKLHRHLNLNVMGGFRDGFVVGGGPEYVF